MDPFLTTDDYVIGTNIYATCNTERLLIVGNPHHAVEAGEQENAATKFLVPKVSANQYRVFRCRLPDPNEMILPESHIPDPKFKYVWQLRGLQVNRGQPMNTGASGAPKFNRGADAESFPYMRPDPRVADASSDHTVPFAFDPKQMQLLVCGNKPAIGEYWGKADACPTLEGDEENPPTCPPIQLRTEFIEDGDFFDMGFGAMEPALRENKYDVPVELLQEITKYIDLIGMQNDGTGDSAFFLTKREQAYARHVFHKDGNQGEPIDENLYPKGPSAQGNCNCTDNYTFYTTPSGSLVNSDNTLFNKPYFLNRGQGHNNGICWLEDLFITVLDNTRNTNMVISVATSDGQTKNGKDFDEGNFTYFLRHTEEFELHLGFRLCKVPLTSPVLFHLFQQNDRILKKWGFKVGMPLHPLPGHPAPSLKDSYRYITDPTPSVPESMAILCPERQKQIDGEPEDQDPYFGHEFWDLDFTDTFKFEYSGSTFARQFFLGLPVSSTAPKRKNIQPPKKTSSKKKKT